MGQESSEIRREIEATRSRMGDTLEDIAYKADVPARLNDAVNDRVESVKGTIGNALSSAKNAVTGTSDSARDAASNVSGRAAESANAVGDSARRAVSIVAQNPLGVALGALALGFLGGLLPPVTDVERERIGPLSDDLADRAQTALSETVEAGKAIAQETVSAAVTSAREKGKTIVDHAVHGAAIDEPDAEFAAT